MVSVVIPAYNEAGNMKIIGEKIACQSEKTGSYEIIFINDACTDCTNQEIKDFAAHNNSVKFLSR